MKTKNKISEFLTHNGEFSHTRLISILGSFIVFIVFCYHPLDTGVQNLMFGILAASLTNATVSKFAKNKENKEEEEEN